MLSLEQQMDLLGSEMGAFTPRAWFEPEMDQLLYLTADCSYRAERVHSLLTLLWHPHEERLVGLKFKGFRWIYQLLAELGKVPHDGFLPLVSVLEAVITAGLYEAQSTNMARESLEELRRKYAVARTIADYNMPISEFPMGIAA